MTEVEWDSDDIWGSDDGMDYLEPDGILMKEISLWPDKTKTSLVTHPSCTTWITVKGLDTVCSVTCDRVELLFAMELDTPISIHRDLLLRCQEIRCFKDLEVSVLSRREATGERKAINYLEKKAKRCPLPSHGETIQIAITALRYLLEEDFKADDIKVYVVGENLWIDRALQVREIEQILDVISIGSPSESSSEEEIPRFEHLTVNSDEGPSESSTEEEIPLFEHLALS